MSALASAQNTGADGFDQSFGLLRSPGLSGVAAKQGWMADAGWEYLHSTGVVGLERPLRDRGAEASGPRRTATRWDAPT